MSKKTLVCIHIMPNEIEMFQKFMAQYRKALMYCNDFNIYIKATLNLNPKLTDWDKSELKQDYFIKIFNEQFQYKLKNSTFFSKNSSICLILRHIFGVFFCDLCLILQ